MCVVFVGFTLILCAGMGLPVYTSIIAWTPEYCTLIFPISLRSSLGINPPLVNPPNMILLFVTSRKYSLDFRSPCSNPLVNTVS